MSSFTDDFTVTILLDSELYRCERDVRYYIGEENSDESLDIFKGALSDGSTIPRITWPIVGHPISSTNGPSGFFHDDLYKTLGLHGKYTRKQCDQIYCEMLEVLGKPRWKRFLMYQALRKFGWIAWNKARKNYVNSTKNTKVSKKDSTS